MIIIWDQIFALLPILIIGLTVILIILSIAYRRNLFKHAIFAMIGVILSLIASFNIIWKDRGSQIIMQLMCIDNFSVLYTILIMISCLTSGLSIYKWLLQQCSNNYHDEFYLLLLMSSMGGVLLTTANHLTILFLGIELITIPLFGLISYSFIQKYSIEVSFKYIILSGVSSSFLLFGIAFIYAATGHLSFNGIKEILMIRDYPGNLSLQFMSLIIIGLGMMIVGFGFKLSFVPFHLWVPDVYQKAPSAVSMYLATGIKVAVISALIRFVLILPDYYNKICYVFLSGSACCTMLLGSLMAVQQNNIKRILAYSSITSAGYLLVALIALNNNPSVVQEAIGIYLIGYLLSIIGAFGIINIISIACIEKDTDTLTIYRGLFWKEPMLSVIFTVIILSLAGIPMTVGFIGKFYLLLVGVDSKLWYLSICILISSIISIIYYLKIIINLYLSPVSSTSFDYKYISNWNITPDGIISIFFSIIILIFGIYPQPIIRLLYLIYSN